MSARGLAAGARPESGRPERTAVCQPVALERSPQGPEGLGPWGMAGRKRPLDGLRGDCPGTCPRCGFCLGQPFPADGQLALAAWERKPLEPLHDFQARSLACGPISILATPEVIGKTVLKLGLEVAGGTINNQKKLSPSRTAKGRPNSRQRLPRTMTQSWK